jgi:hypothetical protein
MAPYEGDAPATTTANGAAYFPRKASESSTNVPLCTRTSDRAEQVIVERVASVSFIAALPEETREKVLEEQD